MPQEIHTSEMIAPAAAGSRSGIAPEYKKIFELLEKKSIRYAVLRGTEELAEANRNTEIDLLVAPAHLALLKSTLASRDFVELPNWGHAPHHFFLTYLPETGFWLKLDVVTELCYGSPVRRFRVDLLEKCLQNAPQSGLRVPGLAAEFVTLFLHCLLDKKSFRREHRRRLTFLQQQISADEHLVQNLETFFARWLSPVFEPPLVAEAIAANKWEELLNRRAALERDLTARQPFASVWRVLRAKVLLALRPLLFALRRRGLAVVLLAPDGAGKSTLAQALRQDKNLRARLIYMGANVQASTVGLPASGWIDSKVKSVKSGSRRVSLYGIGVRKLNFIIKVAERWYRYLMAYYHKARGRLVLFDRFIYDAWVQNHRMTAVRRLKRFLLEAACPAPDLVILLDAPGDLLFKRKGEHTPEWLEQQRQAYLELVRKLPNGHIVDAGKPAEQVRKAVTGIIFRKLTQQEQSRQ